MAEEKFGERVAIVEQRIDSIENKVDKLDATSDTLIELKTIVKMQSEFQERMHTDQKEQMKEFGEVLASVNQNLTHLNSTSDQLKNSIGDLGNRISSIEDTQESHKVDVPKLMTKIFIGIAMISVALLSAYLMKTMGLK